MSQRDRSAEPSNDPEIRAMVAMTRYLPHLSLGQRRRVLAWADKRFASDEPEPDYDFAKKLMNATEEIGRRFGNMSHLEVVMALEKIVEENNKILEEERAAKEKAKA